MKAEINVAELDRSKSWRAWIVVLGGFFGQMGNIFCLAIYGLCMTAIATSFNVAVTSLAIGTSLFGVMTGLCSFIAGHLADRIGFRIIQAGGCWGMGLMLVLASFFANDPTTLIIFYAIAGAFCAGVNNGVNPKIGASWFHTSARGKGMALLILGGSAGGVVFGLIAPSFLVAGGWQLCFKAMGCIEIAFGVVIFLLQHNSPFELGTVPFGTPADEEIVIPTRKQDSVQDKEINHNALVTVLKMPITWKYACVYICYQFYNMSTQAYSTSAILYAGFDVTTAGIVSSCTTAGMCLGTIVMPALSDKYGRKGIFMLMCFVGGGLTIFEIFILGMGNAVLLICLQVSVGFFCALNTIMQTTCSEMFPTGLRGSGPGVCATIAMVGKFCGPLLAAATITAAAGNVPYVFIFAGSSLILMAIFIGIFVPKTGGKYGDPMAEKEAA